MNWDLITLILNIISLICMCISFYYLNQVNKDFKEIEKYLKMNNFICQVFGHKYIQVTEIRVIEFLWKKEEVTKTICKYCKKQKEI